MVVIGRVIPTEGSGGDFSAHPNTSLLTPQDQWWDTATELCANTVLSGVGGGGRRGGGGKGGRQYKVGLENSDLVAHHLLLSPPSVAHCNAQHLSQHFTAFQCTLPSFAWR